MVKSEELVDTTQCLMLYTRFRKNRCRYNRVPLYFRKHKAGKTAGGPQSMSS
jgi:hypothetical protein